MTVCFFWIVIFRMSTVLESVSALRPGQVPYYSIPWINHHSTTMRIWYRRCKLRNPNKQEHKQFIPLTVREWSKRHHQLVAHPSGVTLYVCILDNSAVYFVTHPVVQRRNWLNSGLVHHQLHKSTPHITNKQLIFLAYTPSHQRRGATAVLVRHKPKWHRHDRRGSAVVPSLITVAPRKIVNTADLLPPSHRRRGATAVVVRHKPQWHRHDRRGSVVVPVLNAVAPRKHVKYRTFTVARRQLWTCSKLPQCHCRLAQSAVGSPRHRHYRRDTAMTAVVPYKDRSSISITAVHPQYNRRVIAKNVDWQPCGDPVAFLLRLWQCYHGATTSLARQCCR